MSDAFIRHLIAVIGVLIAGAIYFVGYVSGVNGWWATGLSIIFIYMIVYKLVDAGGHH